MWTIKNNIIPFKWFKAITLWPFIFVRKTANMRPQDITHEEIHGEQQKELLVLPFYLWYLGELAIKSIIKGKSAYRDISFEKEAYQNQADETYPKERKHYAWFKLI